MSNVQLLLTVCLPTLSVLVGILLNNRLLADFKADVNKRMDRLEVRFDRIESDMRDFYRVTTRLESRVDVLERKD